MKNLFITLVFSIAFGSMISCEPSEDRNSLPEVGISNTDLNYKITVTGNKVNLKSLMPEVIPYWVITDASGNTMTNSNKADITRDFPFAGTYNATFSAYTKGGSVASSKTFQVLQNDLTLFSDPRWALLTNGTAGKTWMVNVETESPFAFAGPNFVNKQISGDWSWFPGSISDVSWSGIENKDFGEIKFDLNGGYNVTIKQTSLDLGSTVKTTSKGTFSFLLSNNYSSKDGSTSDELNINGGLEMLHPNAYYKDIPAGFSKVRLIELTATSLRYAVIRNDGVLVIMNLVPKP